jgi:hypothetical protein
MAEQKQAGQSLQGQRIAFTGRLASLTRADAAALVQAHGGQCAPSINRRTTMIVVGQDGWPLRKDGRLSRKLEKGQALQRTNQLSILSEAEFLALLGRDCPEVGRRLTMVQLSQVLGMPCRLIRPWVRLGFIRPAETIAGIDYFDFRQVSQIRTLWKLVQAGIPSDRIRRSIGQLERWLPDAKETLALLEKDGQLLVRLSDGRLAEPSGQGLFDFAEDMGPAELTVYAREKTADEWVQAGCEHEGAGRLPEAAQAYHNALLLHPHAIAEIEFTDGLMGTNADVCCNLGNVLFAQGQFERAAERFRQAVEIDQGHVEAWNNLGISFVQLGHSQEAIDAFEKAIERNPLWADPHYNLADLLDELNRPAEARTHWQAYLRLDATSLWSQYARKKLCE